MSIFQPLTLRDYQEEAIAALFNYFTRSSGNPLLVLPTGSGKSVVQAFFLKRVYQQWPNQKIVCLTHVKELIEQNHEKLVSTAPELSVGIYSASLNSRDASKAITFAGIQSVHRQAAEFGHIDLILIDECHLVPPKGSGMYRRFIEALLEINPMLKVIGMSATPFRLASGLLHEGKGALFTDMAFNLPILRLLQAGHLCPVTTQGSPTKIDYKNVKKQGGEFVLKAMDEAAREISEAAIAEMLRHGHNRRAWLIFCSSVEHAEIITEMLNSAGIDTATVTGATPKRQRETLLTRFKNGELKAITNVDVLTTGFDAPILDMIVFLRGTASASLYIQMVGRGMRNAPGKKNCLVLDFAGNVTRHGPIDNVQVKPQGGGQGASEPVIKECPNCYQHVSQFAKVCEHCGEEFSTGGDFMPQHDTTATRDAILSTEIKPATHIVTGWSYKRHQKEGKPDSVRVTYECGIFSQFNTWVCVEHFGPARDKAYQWMLEHDTDQCGDTTKLKHTTDEILNAFTTGGWRIPSTIFVKKRGKYPEIVGFKFNQKEGLTNV